MIRVLINAAALGACILAYNNGDDWPRFGMFSIGWCSAYLLVSIAKSISNSHGQSSQGL